MNALTRHASRLFLAVVTLAVPAASPGGTIVRFDMNVASFDVELYDTAMPITVANFLSYVNAGSYTSSIIHRSTTYNPSDIQIVQGGGFYLSGLQLLSIPTNAPIVLESGSVGNVRGTIAMARGAATDSATSQFFFNVQNNPALDGNYAVFGNVVGAAGLAALDAIGAVQVYDCSVQLGPTFSELPLTAPSLDVSSLVMVNSAVPEPSTTILALAGLAALACTRRRTLDPHVAAGWQPAEHHPERRSGAG
jgi:cyclophilin family peptidyl-prolyl cis-trans isomerase